MEWGVYTTVHDLKTLELKTEETRDDELLASYCIEASADIRRMARGRFFHPIIQTRYYDYCLPDEIDLTRDLVEATSIKTQNGAVTVPTDSYILTGGGQTNDKPFRRVELLPNGTVTQFYWANTPRKANHITGVWGYMPNWDSAWVNSGDTVLSLSGTTLTVEAVGGADAHLFSPRFKQLQLLKITDGTDTEYMFVLAVNQGDNTLTVERAVNGSTVIASPANLSIYTWRPFDVISRYTRRLAAYYYRQRGNSRADSDRPIITPNGTVLPVEIPREITAAMSAYKWVTVGGG